MTEDQLIEAMARGSLRYLGIDPDQKYRWADWGPETAPHECHWHGLKPEMRAILAAIRAAGCEVVLSGQCNHSGECKAARERG